MTAILLSACTGSPWLSGEDRMDRWSVSSTGGWRQVTCARSSCCALATDGTPACWSNYGSPDEFERPVDGERHPIPRLTAMARDIGEDGVGMPGGDVYAGLDEDGGLVLWEGSTPIADLKLRDLPTGSFLATDVGCALRPDGELACWSDAYTRGVPTGPFVDVAVGDDLACARRAGGELVCWGSAAATPPPGAWDDVVAFGSVACALRNGGDSGSTSGTTRCWGQGAPGDEPTTPVDTGLPSGLTDPSLDGSEALAIGGIVQDVATPVVCGTNPFGASCVPKIGDLGAWDVQGRCVDLTVGWRVCCARSDGFLECRDPVWGGGGNPVVP